MHPVVTEPRDQKSSLCFINHVCMPYSTSGGQMSISPPSLVFSLTLLLFPSGRPGVNPSLLHLVQTTHTLSGAAVAHQQRVSLHVCASVYYTTSHWQHENFNTEAQIKCRQLKWQTNYLCTKCNSFWSYISAHTHDKSNSCQFRVVIKFTTLSAVHFVYNILHSLHPNNPQITNSTSWCE